MHWASRIPRSQLALVVALLFMLLVAALLAFRSSGPNSLRLSHLRAIVSSDFYPASDLHRRLCDNSITASIDRKLLAQKLNARVKWSFGSEPLILMHVCE